jgi:PAS domain-containing protein
VAFPSVADTLFLCSYVLMAAGLAHLMVGRSRRSNPGAVLDSAVTTLGIGALLWMFLIGPNVQGGLDLAGRLVSVASPLMDFLMLAILVALWPSSPAPVGGEPLDRAARRDGPRDRIPGHQHRRHRAQAHGGGPPRRGDEVPALVEDIPGVVYTAEPGATGGWFYVSPQIRDLLGYTEEEWLADPGLWFQRIHEDDRGRVLAAEMAGTSITGVEYRMRRRDGDIAGAATRDGSFVGPKIPRARPCSRGYSWTFPSRSGRRPSCNRSRRSGAGSPRSCTTGRCSTSPRSTSDWSGFAAS